MNPTLKKLLETGIPVPKVQFHAAVNNADNTPENYFSTDSLVASRRAEMWLTPNLLICRQKNQRNKICYFWVPITTCIFGNFEEQTEEIEGLDEIDPSDTMVPNIPTTKRGRPFKTTNN